MDMPLGNDGSDRVDHSPPENTLLIIEGTRSVPLNQGIIKIGRSHDNTVVIDDPRVSRHHVELRAINGHYVLFDLGSSGGTYINGRQAGQAVLYSGDLISLAGVNLVIREAPPSGSNRPGASPSLGGSGERATVIFRSSSFDKKKK